MVFECVTTTGQLTWQESGVTETFTTNDKGASRTAVRFHLEVIDVINGSVIVSTATIPEVMSSDTGIQLNCIEHVQPLTEIIAVSGKLL